MHKQHGCSVLKAAHNFGCGEKKKSFDGLKFNVTWKEKEKHVTIEVNAV